MTFFCPKPFLHPIFFPFIREFGSVFRLCMYVLSKCQNNELILETLKTLSRFLSWIPIGYIFETQLLEALALKCFRNSKLKVQTLDCLSEVTNIKELNPGNSSASMEGMGGAVVNTTSNDPKIMQYKKKLCEMGE